MAAPRRLTPDERDALLQDLVDAQIDQTDLLRSIDQRLISVERHAGAFPTAVLREALGKILESNIKTCALFVLLIFCVLAGAAVYLGSEATLTTLAGRAPNSLSAASPEAPPDPVLPPVRREEEVP